MSDPRRATVHGRRRTAPIELSNIHKSHGFKKEHPDKIIIRKLEKKIEDQQEQIEVLETEKPHQYYKDMILRRDEQIKETKGLLKIAKCPNCDGSGTIMTHVIRSGSRQISDTEFEQVPIDDWEPEQCEWCDEKNKALK